MRESIGGTWIFGIVVTFIVLFSSYLAISVNYSKAFHVKNEIVSIIEKYEGFNNASKNAIDTYVKGYGYGVRGSCSGNERGVDESNGRFKYCVSCVTKVDSLTKTYYTVKVFFKLDLPIVGNIFTFPVTGSTKSIHFATNDNDISCSILDSGV